MNNSMYTYFEQKELKIYKNYKQSSYSFSSHFHSKTEIAYCFCGLQNVKVGNKLYTLKKGDAIIIFPNVIHEYIEAEENTNIKTESVSLMCETDYLTKIIPDFTTKHPASPYLSSEQLSGKTAFAFENLKKSNDEIELLGWTFIALSGIINNLELIPVKQSDELNLAPNLISYININFQKPLTIKYLGKEFGYSSSYIAHIFYDRLKIPFRTYLGKVRSEYAANLISTTNKNLTEIAYECGYSSINTFCRCFKKHFSKTPSQYKKSVLDNVRQKS